MALNVLITGASVAGNALAWWLGRDGAAVTVVERAPAFRDGGQNVDVRGVGRAVMREMGLEQAALERGTGETGTAWIDADGEIAACFPTDEHTGDGPTAEMEILRGDLARLLYDAASDRATYRFGDHVTAVDQTADAVEVSFASGTKARYDAVIVAEGVGSATRDLVFPGENWPRWMNMAIAYFTIPRVESDDRLWRWFHAPGGLSVSLRPDQHGTTRAMLTVQKPPGGEEKWSTERQQAWLRDMFADAGWQSRRVLAGMAETDDFYFDTLRQVRMPRWSNGRVALCGDAAWCVTPIGGVGTTLAVTGARVLAGEIARGPDLATAFGCYERAMRPMVEQAQGVPRLAPRLANPHSRAGIRALHAALAFASRPAVRGIANKLSGGERVEPDLSRYDDANSDAASSPEPRGSPPGGHGRAVAIGALVLAGAATAIIATRRLRTPAVPQRDAERGR